MSNTNHQKILNLVTLSILIAIEVVLVVANVGFIMIPPISITILHIPVIIGAIIMGWKSGLILGAGFGILSMLNATFRGVSPADLAFSPFYSDNPVGSIIMCILCRILMGFVAGILYQKLSSVIHNVTVSSVIASFVATLVHTASVMTCMWLLFPDTQVTFKAVLQTIFALNFVLEAVVAVIFAVAFAHIIPIVQRKFS